MGNENSLITSATRNSAFLNSGDYTGAIAHHISGDYGGHNQTSIGTSPFPITQLAPGATYSAHSIQANCISFGVTINGADYTVIVPGFPVGAFSGGGSGSGGIDQTAPIFTQQPIGGTFVFAAHVVLTVAVDGTAPISLQWTKNGTVIAGATGTTLTLNWLTTGAGAYACIATNAVGQTISSTATVTTFSFIGAFGVLSACFVQDTKITLQDGTTRQVDTVQKGSALRALDIKGLTTGQPWEFNSTTLSANPVVSQVTSVLKYSVRSFFRINGDLGITSDHPMLVKRGQTWQFMAAGKVVVGDYLFKNGSAVQVRSVEQVDNPTEVWNVTTTPYGVFMANGYVVYNAS